MAARGFECILLKSVSSPVYHSGFGGPVNVARTTLSDDPDTATAQTIAIMAAFCREDAASDAIQRQADRLRGADREQSLKNVWNWIRARVRFVQDRSLALEIPDHANIAEVLVRPVDIIRMRHPAGDCDDFAMLGMALLLAQGIPVQFCTVAADANFPEQYSHVYLVADGVPFDCSHGSYIGWEVPNVFGKRALWNSDGVPVMIRTGSAASPGLSGIGLGLAYTVPWWQQAIENVTDVIPDILKARYAVPPEGTVIQTQGGMVTRVPYPSAFGAQVSTPGAIPVWMWGAAAVVLLMLLMRKGGKG